MSVSNGQDVNAQVTNAAFVSKTSDSTVVSKITLNRGASGPEIPDAQQAINDLLNSNNTLQSQITANSSAITTNKSTTDAHAAATSVHGLAGNVVGTSDPQLITNKDYDGGTASNTNRLTLPQNTLANLTALTRKAGAVYYGTDTMKTYYDNGTTLIPLPTPVVVPIDVSIAALDVDWSLGDSYYKSISANSTFTFSNVVNGKTITVLLKNTAAGNITVSFPTALSSGSLNVTIKPNNENAYTFIRSNSKYYVVCTPDMV